MVLVDALPRFKYGEGEGFSVPEGLDVRCEDHQGIVVEVAEEPTPEPDEEPTPESNEEASLEEVMAGEEPAPRRRR